MAANMIQLNDKECSPHIKPKYVPVRVPVLVLVPVPVLAPVPVPVPALGPCIFMYFRYPHVFSYGFENILLHFDSLDV